MFTSQCCAIIAPRQPSPTAEIRTLGRVCSGQAWVPGTGAGSSARGRLHLNPAGRWHVRLHSVRDRRVREPGPGQGVLGVETDQVRRGRDPPGPRYPGPGRPTRRRAGDPLQRCRAQYTSVHLGETLLLHGMVPSIGSVGDAFDIALAETTIGLYKHECIRADSPFRRGPLERLSDLEMITADRVHWYQPVDASPRPNPTGRSRAQLPR
jgi:hypothetical protein